MMHKVFATLFLLSLIPFLGVYVWVGFDIHNRIGFAMFAQIPVLALLLLTKLTKPPSDPRNSEHEGK